MATLDDLAELATLHQVKLGGGGFFNQITPDTAGYQGAGSGTTEVVRRPWLEEPDGSVPFDEQGGVVLPASPSNDTIVLSFQVPDGFDGVINAVSNNFLGGGFVGFSGDIIWRILADGRAIRNFENIRAEKGTVEQPRKVSPIRIYSRQTVEYVVNHAANGLLNGQVICSATGYFYPSQG